MFGGVNLVGFVICIARSREREGLPDGLKFQIPGPIYFEDGNKVTSPWPTEEMLLSPNRLCKAGMILKINSVLIRDSTGLFTESM